MSSASINAKSEVKFLIVNLVVYHLVDTLHVLVSCLAGVRLAYHGRGVKGGVRKIKMEI